MCPKRIPDILKRQMQDLLHDKIREIRNDISITPL